MTKGAFAGTFAREPRSLFRVEDGRRGQDDATGAIRAIRVGAPKKISVRFAI
jgi:hypothetical protein